MKHFINPLSISLVLLLPQIGQVGAATLNTNLDPSKAGFSGRLGLWANSLVEEVGDVPGNLYYGELDLRYAKTKQVSEGKLRDFAAEIKTRTNNEGQFMFSLKQLSYGIRTEKSEIRFGRTNLEWSTIDKEWGLGRINNRVNFDFLEPGQEGLVGIFADHKFDSGFKIGLFLSSFYIPETNPGQDIDSDAGTVKCRNPWCSAPAETTEVSGNDVDVFYNINIPDIAEIVFQNSGGINLGYEYIFNESEKGKSSLDLSIYALRKPENSLTISAEARLINGPPQVAFVDITPQIFFHNILGADAKLKIAEHDLLLYASAISITPNGNPEGGDLFFQYTGIRQRKTREDYISAGIEYATDNFRAVAGFISRQSTFDRADDLLVDFPRWNEAGHIILEKSFSSLSFSLDFKFDTITNDRITLFSSNYQINKNLLAGLGLNIIGTNPNEDSFWSNFENNDAAYAKIDYSF